MGTKLTDVSSIETIISEMTAAEKALLVTGGSPFASQPMEQYGIPAVCMLDGGTGFNSLQYGAEVGYKMEAGECAAAGHPIDRENFGGMGGLLLGLGRLQRMAAEKAQSQDAEQKQKAEQSQDAEQKQKAESDQKKEHACYPPGMFFGATWNPEPIEACGRALGKEMTSKGVDIILGTPNVNIHRDPLNGRLFEGYSEDPCLVSKLAPAFVKGVQSAGAIADVKHFAANNQETDRMGVEEHIPERALREIYLPGFKACVDAGCRTVMSAYNKINGVPCAMNHWLLTDILRDEWGFDGFVMSDWSGAYDQVEAVAAGNDLAMPGPRGIRCITQAIEEGRLSEEALDTCVRNILKVFLETPAFTGKRGTFSMEESMQACEYAAREGITLLKNDGTLPLSETDKVAFYGKRSRAFSGSGAGSAAVDTDLLTNPYDSTAALIGAENVTFGETQEGTNVWIVTVGANGQEGADRPHMDMDADDALALEQAIAEAAKVDGKVILILNTEGPVSLMEYESRVNGILCAYYPGMCGGKVLADILFGRTNPSGKLPLTYPKYYHDCPAYKNFPGENKEVWYGEGIYVGYRHYDARHIEPLYPFGFGMSYTTFELSDLKTEKVVNVDERDITVSVKVKNTGNMAGSQVVQLYVHDVVSKLDKPYKELKGFCKVFLNPGEEKNVEIILNKESLSSYSLEKKQWVCEPGEFDLLIGTSAADILLKERIQVKCKNPFGLTKASSIGEIVTDERAVKMINKVINGDILKAVNAAIVFAPGKTWEEVWESSVVPVLKKTGLEDQQIADMFHRIIDGFEE